MPFAMDFQSESARSACSEARPTQSTRMKARTFLRWRRSDMLQRIPVCGCPKGATGAGKFDFLPYSWDVSKNSTLSLTAQRLFGERREKLFDAELFSGQWLSGFKERFEAGENRRPAVADGLEHLGSGIKIVVSDGEADDFFLRLAIDLESDTAGAFVLKVRMPGNAP